MHDDNMREERTRRPVDLRELDYYLSGEHALGAPVLGPEDYWSRLCDLIGEDVVVEAWCLSNMTPPPYREYSKVHKQFGLTKMQVACLANDYYDGLIGVHRV